MALPAELALERVWERVVGRPVSRGFFVDSLSARRRLLDQSKDVVARLEREGIASRAPEPVHLVGACTGSAELAQAFRNSNLIPIVQSRNVHGMLRDLRYVVDTTPRRQLRMWVVSNGWQPLAGYRDAHRSFTRRLSKFAARPELEELGLEVLFYNVEVTVHRDELGRPVLNQHSHLVVRSRRRVGADRWRRFCEWARGQFPKRHFHDAGAVEDPAELVKYAFKPDELAGLADAEFADLFRQSHRLKFFQPLGAFRELRRELKGSRLRLVQVPRAPGAAELEWVTVPRARAPERDEPSSAVAEGSQVIGLTFPQPRFSPRAEPCLLVKGWRGDLGDLLRDPRIASLVQLARKCWKQNCALEGVEGAASMGHTTTTTVRRRGHHERDEGRAERPPVQGGRQGSVGARARVREGRPREPDDLEGAPRAHAHQGPDRGTPGDRDRVQGGAAAGVRLEGQGGTPAQPLDYLGRFEGHAPRPT